MSFISVVSDSVIFVPEGSGAVPETVTEKLRQIVSVGDFGPDPTGAGDSTAAFNLATARLRTLIVDTDYDYVGYELVVPPGVYSVSSWDLTSLLVQNVHVVAHGAVLKARTAGKHVVDCIGSRYIKFHGLTVYSSSDVIAKSAIQVGPTGTEANGNIALNDVSLLGYYSVAPYVNLGSETTSLFNCRFLQRNTDPAVYAQVCDGLGTYLPTSDYATITRGAGVAVSYTANSYHGTQLRNEGGGSASYLAGTQGWEFDLGCYHLSFDASAAVIYGTGTYRTAKLALRGSFENSQNDNPTPGNIGLRYAVTFDNDGTNTAIDGFTFESTNMQAETFVFRNAGAGTLRLSDADIRVHSIDEAGCLMFGTSGSISIDGVLMTQSAAKTNLDALTALSGILHINDRAALPSTPATGTNLIFSRADQSCYTRGQFLPLAEPPAFTPEVTFATPGDLSVVYTVQVGRYAVLAGGAVYVEVSVTFTPTYTTASGEFRISGLPNAMQSLNVSGVDHALPLTVINSAFTWPASATQVVARLNSNSTNFRLYGLGSGIGPTIFTTTNVPSGTAKSIAFSGVIMPKPN